MHLNRYIDRRRNSIYCSQNFGRKKTICKSFFIHSFFLWCFTFLSIYKHPKCVQYSSLVDIKLTLQHFPCFQIIRGWWLIQFSYTSRSTNVSFTVHTLFSSGLIRSLLSHFLSSSRYSPLRRVFHSIFTRWSSSFINPHHMSIPSHPCSLHQFTYSLDSFNIYLIFQTFPVRYIHGPPPRSHLSEF